MHRQMTPPVALTSAKWLADPDFVGLNTVSNNIYSSDGTPYSVGRLSTDELQHAALRILGGIGVIVHVGQSDLELDVLNWAILGTALQCLKLNHPVFVIRDKHFTVYLPLSDGVFLFNSLETRDYDSVAAKFAAEARGRTFSYCQMGVRPTAKQPYQGIRSDLCGNYCLFVTYLWVMQRGGDDKDTMDSRTFIETIDTYLTTGRTIDNDFNMQYWTLLNAIGEEFEEPHSSRYKQTKLIESLTIPQ